jgi:hypothetical protein
MGAALLTDDKLKGWVFGFWFLVSGFWFLVFGF